MNADTWATVAKVDKQRIHLPSEFAKLAGVEGVLPKSQIDCWLLVIKEGRFLLQKQDPPPTDGPIAKILNHLERLASIDSADENEEEIAIRARLFPCSVTWHERGPRLNAPKEILYLASGERSHVFLLNVDGCVEVWFPEKLQRAVSVPLDDILP
jgi:hypothetical protein